MKCPKCGGEVRQDVQFCDHCGYELHPQMACPYCGKMVRKGAAFCSGCGKSLTEDAKTDSQKKASKQDKTEKLIIAAIICVVIVLVVFVIVWIMSHGGVIVDPPVSSNDSSYTDSSVIDSSKEALDSQVTPEPTPKASEMVIQTPTPAPSPSTTPSAEPSATPEPSQTANPSTKPSPTPTATPTPSEDPGETEIAAIQGAEVGDIVNFGTYEQDNNSANGKEAIEWIILAKEDNQALLISKYALDCQRFSIIESDSIPLLWEDCELRSWLNSYFISNAFSTEEKKKLKDTIVTAEDNPDFGTDAGADTQDQVFLLSCEEVLQYFSSDEDRICQATDYALAQGVYYCSMGCYWWLRSPGAEDSKVVQITPGGVGDSMGIPAYENDVGVRPAMWISLDS